MRPRWIALAGIALYAAVPAAPAGAPITLRTVPPVVYKLRDPGRLPLESWLFQLVVTGPDDLRPVGATIELRSGATRLETVTVPESILVRRRATSYRPTPDSLALQRRLILDEAFDLRMAFPARPLGWKTDLVRVTLALATGSTRVTRTLDVPLAIFAPKTPLVFPLRGPAMVSQGSFNNAGHAGHANQFAIDVLGLNDTYGPMVAGRTGNEEYAGWGREVLAPGAGRVVHARNDVPDNAPDANPVDTYGRLPEPMLAVAGNCVVIDHGNGEWSALMHLQHGSVGVKVGDTVAAGQPIGRLGNSGDAFGPHLHIQLQDGPELLRANSLPLSFTNLPNADLSRGSYLTPR